MCRETNLEQAKRTQRLLDSTPIRSASRLSMSNTLHGDISDQDLTRDLQRVNEWFERGLLSETVSRRQSYRDSLAPDDASRRSSYHESPLIPPNSTRSSREILSPGYADKDLAELYQLKRGLEDVLQERQQRRPQETQQRRPLGDKRRATVDSVHSDDVESLAESVETIRIARSRSLQPNLSPGQSNFPPPSPLPEHSHFPSSPGEEELQTNPWTEQPSPSGLGIFDPVNWNSPAHERNSIATTPSTFSTASLFSHPGYSTARTTPEDRPLRRRLSSSSLASLALGPSALTWTLLCSKVQVERTTGSAAQTHECNLFYRYNKSLGLSLKSMYRSRSSPNPKIWITQDFPASGAALPLTTTHPDGDTSMEFPKRNFEKLSQKCTDIKYTFSNPESSKLFQTLLYTNGKMDAELLFDRPILRIHTNKRKDECRGKNIRLWLRTEKQSTRNGIADVEVLMLVFYTSARDEIEARWVEEPHYVFEWIEESVYKKKNTDKVKFVFSKEPGRWRPDKIFRQRRKSSNTGAVVEGNSPPLSRSNTAPLFLSSTTPAPTQSQSSFFGTSTPTRTDLNRYGYSELEIKFQSVKDRNEFLEIWRKYVKPKPLGYQGEEVGET